MIAHAKVSSLDGKSALVWRAILIQEDGPAFVVPYSCASTVNKLDGEKAATQTGKVGCGNNPWIECTCDDITELGHGVEGINKSQWPGFGYLRQGS